MCPFHDGVFLVLFERYGKLHFVFSVLNDYNQFGRIVCAASLTLGAVIEFDEYVVVGALCYGNHNTAIVAGKAEFQIIFLEIDILGGRSGILVGCIYCNKIIAFVYKGLISCYGSAGLD